MRAEISAAVQEIREDRERGARQLALAALQALASVAPTCATEELREAARALALARPLMAAIANAVAWAWSRLLETGDAPRAIGEVMAVVEMALEGLATAARGILPTGTLMTYSYSSTVVEVLGRVEPGRLIISEGRPLNEGLKTARELAEAGVSMTLITEAQMALFVQEADAVVVGADTILPDGGFVNKVGTRLLALAAGDARVPLYVLSETLKVAAASAPKRFAAEEGRAREVYGEKWLEVRNVYFEVTPARLVTAYITEDGLLRQPQMRRYARKAERRWRALMDEAPARGA